jgi:hypothetical protein
MSNLYYISLLHSDFENILNSALYTFSRVLYVECDFDAVKDIINNNSYLLYPLVVHLTCTHILKSAL